MVYQILQHVFSCFATALLSRNKQLQYSGHESRHEHTLVCIHGVYLTLQYDLRLHYGQCHSVEADNYGATCPPGQCEASKTSYAFCERPTETQSQACGCFKGDESLQNILNYLWADEHIFLLWWLMVVNLKSDRRFLGITCCDAAAPLQFQVFDFQSSNSTSFLCQRYSDAKLWKTKMVKPWEIRITRHQGSIRYDEGGWSPLCFAAMSGNTTVVSALLEKKVSPNDATKQSKILATWLSCRL